LTEELMTKLRFDVRLDQGSLENFVTIESQLKGLGKLAKPIDYKLFIEPKLLSEVKPEAVNLPGTKN
jgi:hypothetical protein